MNLIDTNIQDLETRLEGIHVPLPRAEDLRKAVTRVVTKYAAKAATGRPFEARGLVVTGPSRIGKTFEIDAVLAGLDRGETIMPDGRAARLVKCELSGQTTFKELGVLTLEALGYPYKGRLSQALIWELVRKQAMLQGVIGIHFDEVQHVLAPGGRSARLFLDSFKSLLKSNRWPLILILSGVSDLDGYLDSSSIEAQQLRGLLDRVQFGTMDPRNDLKRLNRLLYTYGDAAGLDVDGLSSKDFLRRLAFASLDRWGLAIEYIIGACCRCAEEGRRELMPNDFGAVFSSRMRTGPGFSPFEIDDYRSVFDAERMRPHLEA